MRKIITLFSFVITVFLQANAQEQWNAVKVFDLDTDEAASVYNMYIDSVETTNGDAVFCFQTDSKLIKTDFNGEVIDATVNPYPHFTVFNGDTLICRDKDVINASSGDTVYHSIYYCRRIAASSSEAYVFIQNPYRNGKPSYVITLDQRVRHSTYLFAALCCSKSELYIIEHQDSVQGSLFIFNENTREKIKTIHTVKDPRGIAVYRGTLYVYSGTDKAVYRLESAGGTTVVKPTQTQIEALQTVYYNLLGEETDSPSGLTIVVTRYSDGSVRTEKKLFR